MISIEKALLLDRRMRALSGLDGPAFLKLEKRFARVLAEEVAPCTRAGQPRQRAAGARPQGRAARRAPQTFLHSLLSQSLSDPGCDGLFLWLEPAAGLR